MTTCKQDKARQLYNGVGLAPMVRAGTTPLRTLALQYGADFIYTEELMDRSVSSTRRVVNTHMKTVDYVKDVANMNNKTLKKVGEHAPLLLRVDPQLERQKLIIQIGTGEPELALSAATHVYQDADGIDINMGCPKRFSVSGGMGSALLSDPDRASRIIRTLSNTLTETPISAKIRLLKDTQSTIDFIGGLVNAGCNAVAIHGRRVGDQEIQPAKWDELKEVLSIVTMKYKHIPFLLNGDFYTRQEFTDFMAETGASGVLLGRPALYNTSIFRKPPVTADQSATYSYDSSMLLDKTSVIQEYLQHALQYNTHYKNVKYVIGEMMSFRRTPSPRVPFLPHVYPRGQTIGKTCECRSLQELCKVWDVNYQTHIRTEEHQITDYHKFSDAYIKERLADPAEEVNNQAPLKRVKVDSIVQ
jgi:tRNA-dihydrouridine synthase 2